MSELEVKAELNHIQGYLFDLDGVLTPTAMIHEKAWADLLTPVFMKHCVAPYVPSDYFSFIDGKPRRSGVRSALQSRGLVFPEGSDDDPLAMETISGLAQRKDASFLTALERDGVVPYDGSMGFLEAVFNANAKVAVVSSSRNARAVLAAARTTLRGASCLLDLFDVIVDGVVAEKRGLPGKPAPDTFWYAAGLLDVPVCETAVVEDATSGVRAGSTGGFATVIGVDRGAGEKTLYEAGASIVVRDLSELLVTEVNR